MVSLRTVIFVGLLCITASSLWAGDALDRWVLLADADSGGRADERDGGKQELRLEDFIIPDGVIVWRSPGKVRRDFWGGAGVGFLGHETGHLLMNLLVGTTPHVESVHYGLVPFFTWEPGRKLNDREHYLTASAGFTAQHAIDEWILTRHPHLRDEANPYFKGVLTFNYWLSVGYAVNAFIAGGPNKRDTKGMADSARISEDLAGALVLAPALLDAYRYNHPDARWARRASRAAKLLVIGLALRARP